MTTNRMAFAVYIAVFVAVGNSTMAGDRLDELESELIKVRNELIREVNKQRIAYAEDLRILQEQNQQLVEEIRLYGEIIQQLKIDNTQLFKRVEQLENSASTSGTGHSAELEKLRNLIRQESESRQKSYNALVNEVTNALTDVGRGISVDGAADVDAYGIYEVVKGDTLGAIAKAFKVSVSRLQDVNNLKGDTIYVGQRLKIPK